MGTAPNQFFAWRHEDSASRRFRRHEGEASAKSLGNFRKNIDLFFRFYNNCKVFKRWPPGQITTVTNAFLQQPCWDSQVTFAVKHVILNFKKFLMAAETCALIY